MGNNKQIVEVQAPSTHNGKSPNSLKPRILDSTYEPTPVSRSTLDRVQVDELNARKTIPLQEPTNTGHRVMMQVIAGLQVNNPGVHTPQQFCEPGPGEMDPDIWSADEADAPLF
jgi:hypothetical protein